MSRTVKARCATAAGVMPVPAVVVLTATTAPSAIGATSATSSTTTEQIQLLANHQLADGAILGPGNSINPSFANLAAIGLAPANDPTGNSVVYKWMQWYLGHLNAIDAHGFKDTISQATAGSGALVGSNILTYEAIANLDDYPAPTAVRQPDGLTVAVAGGSTPRRGAATGTTTRPAGSSSPPRPRIPERPSGEAEAWGGDAGGAAAALHLGGVRPQRLCTQQ